MTDTIQKTKCSHLTKAGNPCKNYSRGEGGYCNSHTKRNPESADLTKDSVFGNKSTEIDISENTVNRLKYSTFLITVNSQRDIIKLSDEEKILFKEFTEFLFSESELTDNLIDLTNTSDPRSNLKKITIDYYYEVGEKFGKLHLHAIIDITHNGIYKFDLNRMREVSHEILGYNLHINIRGSADHSAMMRAYVSKKSTSNVINLSK